MTILLIYAFIAGIITILSPCILPLLPLILSGGTSHSRSRPLGVIFGFVSSFTFFTLFLATLVQKTGVDATTLRHLAVFSLLLFGLTLVNKRLKILWENLTARLAPQIGRAKPGFWGGIVVGVSLGLIWTPCVGPILASVITLAASSTINSGTILITLAYSLGTSIPLFLIMLGSSHMLNHFTKLKQNSSKIQQIFGALMIATALLIYFEFDRNFQSYILSRFPNYGIGLTRFEDNETIKQKLSILKEQGGRIQPLAIYSAAPDITKGTNWQNSPPLTLSSLRGQVVLIDFWTYSCINCIRTLPYLKAWHTKYANDGLVIIGVHSPEFEFEKDLDNLKRAIRDFGIEYPVVQDNDFLIWQAYDNHYWPAKYLIDKEGRIRYFHFGEGNYRETEAAVQELLGESLSDSTMVSVPPYSVSTRSPETYLGYWRLANFASNPQVQPDTETTYTTDKNLSLNHFGLTGAWTIKDKYSVSTKGSKLHFRYDATSVNLVMRPVDNKPKSVNVYIDGNLHNNLTVDFDQLYQLVNHATQEEHELTVEFPEGGVEVYAFTFG